MTSDAPLSTVSRGAAEYRVDQLVSWSGKYRFGSSVLQLDDVNVGQIQDLAQEVVQELAGLRGIVLAAGIVLGYFIILEPLLDMLEGEAVESDGGETVESQAGSSAGTARTPRTGRERGAAARSSRSKNTGRESSQTGGTSTGSSGGVKSNRRSSASASRQSGSSARPRLGPSETYELQTGDGRTIVATVAPMLAAPNPPSHDDGRVRAALVEIVERAERNDVMLTAADLREFSDEIAEEYGIWIQEAVPGS